MAVVELHDCNWEASRMCEKVFLGLLLVGFQGSLEDSLEARGSVRLWLASGT